MRSYGNRVDPKSNENILMRDRIEQTETQWRILCEDGSRDWNDAHTSQGTPRKPGEAWNRFSLSASRRNYFCWHLDFVLLISRTVGEINFCCFKSPTSWQFVAPDIGNWHMLFKEWQWLGRWVWKMQLDLPYHSPNPGAPQMAYRKLTSLLSHGMDKVNSRVMC